MPKEVKYKEGPGGIPIYEPGKEVPPLLVVLWGVSIWVCIFGTILLFWTFQPCKFVEVVVGSDNVAMMKDPSLRNPPCNPATEPGCKVWSLNTKEECLCLLSAKEAC